MLIAAGVITFLVYPPHGGLAMMMVVIVEAGQYVM